MLDAWINKDDIIRFLDECKGLDNLVERLTFIRGINKLEEHKRPKPPKKPKINYASNIKKDIKAYLNEVKNGNKSYLDKWLDEKIIKSGEAKDTTRRELVGERLVRILKVKYDADELYLKMNMIPKRDLKTLLKVSERTVQRWEERHIIKRHTELERYRRFEYYNLSEIMEALKTFGYRQL